MSVLQVKVIPATDGQKVTLMCGTSCPLTESPSAYIWYKNGEFLYEDWSPWYQELVSSDKAVRYSCAVKGNEDFRAPEVSVGLAETNCWRVNYVSRTICALEGSSLNITSEYLHPSDQQPKYKHWYKLKNGRVEDAEMMTEAVDRVKFYDNMKNQHILEMKNLKKNDSAEYRFRLQQRSKNWIKPNLPGIRMTVTDLRVTFSPSAEVTEGQKVTLTCSTSCPLTDDANYIWYWNTQLLTPQENQNKHLIVEVARIQHAGNYSCAVNTLNNTRSNEKTLTVHRKMGTWILAAVAGATAAFLVITVLAVVCCIR
ncbi:B-cell receptor CD22-like [Cheilinus undulatus]|uniref:B-cell receptor CD22-like n=1 Tax=Cheilinus undulatus TaxID=241271 RepID=UPI001BD339AF|nr:B-cell receptor CD22-like [Cheilinus undulatus]